MFSMFRKSNDKNVQNDTFKTTKQNKSLPSFINWSPSSSRRQVNPSNVTRQIHEPHPNPIHFNRPSPVTSPIPLRRSRTEEHVNVQAEDEIAPWRSPLSRKRRPQNTETFSSRKEGQNFLPHYSNNENIFQKNNVEEKRDKSSEKQTDRQIHDDSSRQYNESNGHLSNSESIASMTYSDGQSFSQSVERSLVVSNLSTKMECVKDNTSTVKVSDKTTTEEKASNNIVHSPTPWRKARPTEAVAKDDASSLATPWRKEKELVSVNSESIAVSSSSNTKSITTHCIATSIQERQSSKSSFTISEQNEQYLTQKSEKNQAEHIQQNRQTQQEQSFFQKKANYSVNQQEAPWRSPQLKKKERSTTQSPSFLNLRTTASSLSEHKISTKDLLDITEKDKNTSKEPDQDLLSFEENKNQVPCANTSESEINKESLNIVNTSPTPLSLPVTLSNTPPPSSPPPPPPPIPPQLNKETKLLLETFSSAVNTSSNINMPSSTESSEVCKEQKQEDAGSLPPTETKEQISESITPEVPLETKQAEQQEFPDSISGKESPPPPPSIPVENQDDLVSNIDQSPLPPPPPPPPTANIEQTCAPQFPVVIPDSLPLEPSSPEYHPEPVTNRIQLFEKQASCDGEKKEKEVPPAKPVAPWVKKTSTGPVHQEGWDLSPIEGVPVQTEEPSVKMAQRNLKQNFPDPSVSSIKMVLTQPFKDEGIPAPKAMSSPQEQQMQMLQHKQLQVLRYRPRTRSQGDYSHSYVDHDVLKMEPGAFASVTHGGKHGISPLAKQTDENFDPACDPNNPKEIKFQDISAAAFKIKSGIVNTPCTYSNISSIVGMEVYFKKEFNQVTGSFKERGARYTLICLSDEQKAKGVIAASAGNHALALSYHGQDLGIPVTVVMPLVAPIMKVQACRQYGANVLVKGADIGEGREIAMKMAKELRLTYINGYDHPDILAGQGTMGLEIVEQVQNIDAVVVPVGGAGLIAGLALAVKSLYPHIKVIGVESERCPSFHAAMKSKKPIYVKAESSLADGLNVPKVGVNAFATASKLVDKTVVVKEEWIAVAILRLVEIEKAVVEGAGATALAALLADELPELKGKRVVIPLCGGNIDTTVLGRCLERGLAADGRLVKFTVRVSDRPGGIADLTRLLANLGVSIKDMLHERAWIRSDIFSVEVKVLCETRDHEHSEELKEALLQRYRHLQFSDL